MVTTCAQITLIFVSGLGEFSKGIINALKILYRINSGILSARDLMTRN